MNRLAFRMRLRPGSEAIYKQIHDEIPREMLELIASTGAQNYTIFREGLDLFAYLEYADEITSVDGSHPVLAKWWKALEPHMDYNDDGSPTVSPMEEVFHCT
jgi:L-rhamnose mutarotase